MHSYRFWTQSSVHREEEGLWVSRDFPVASTWGLRMAAVYREMKVEIQINMASENGLGLGPEQ